MNLFRISWRSLVDRPLAMTLSLVLFALGIGLISLLFQLEKQLQDSFEKNLAEIDLVIGAKGSPLQMILSSMYHVDAPTGNVSIDEVRPFLNPAHPLIKDVIPLALGDSYGGYRIVGTTVNILEWYGVSVAEGKVWESDFEVLAGRRAADVLGLKLGDTFKSSHGFMDDEGMEHDDAEDFRIVGVLEKSGTVLDQLLLTTPQSFWHVHNHEEDEHSEGVASGTDLHSDHDHSQARSLLEEEGDQEITNLLLRFKGRNFQALNMQRSINENTDMQAATPAIEINRLFNMMDSGEQALRILAWVIIFVSGLSIFISLYSSLADRKYELALMRVVGARPHSLFLLILIEGMILTILGSAIGLFLSHAGMEVIGLLMEDQYRYDFHGRSFLAKEGLLLIGALLIGFVAALLPAIQASKTEISETLTKG